MRTEDSSPRLYECMRAQGRGGGINAGCEQWLSCCAVIQSYSEEQAVLAGKAS